jgi:hypothetical protein
MTFLGILLLIVLIIPVIAILSDSPLGRAAARRLDGDRPVPSPPEALAERVEDLEGEVEALTRQLEELQEEHQFFQRLLEEGGQRRPPTSLPGS